MAGKVALDPSQKARELSTTSTVDNRLADGRGLSGAADRSRIPSLSLAHVPSFPSRSLIRRLSLRLILSSPSFRMPAPLAPSLSFLFSLRLFFSPRSPPPFGCLRDTSLRNVRTATTEGVRTRSENTEITGLRRERRRVTYMNRVRSRENSPPGDSRQFMNF